MSPRAFQAIVESKRYSGNSADGRQEKLMLAKFTYFFKINSIVWSIFVGVPTVALPPPEDTPEEILRTEIFTEARSPIDGKPLTAAEYAELQIKLQRQVVPPLSANVRDTISLLRLRRLIRTLIPFLPI